ncbi:MAG: molybdate ABC transporter substrate-binding protein [Actinomycetota bacterium]
MLLTSACSAAGGDAETNKLTVFAAASLTAAFTQIGADFEAANPGVSVTFNFGPAGGLAAQIESEGTADVFAPASLSWMDEVANKVGVHDRTDFARNTLTIITPPDDPAGIGSIADLARPGIQLVLAAPGVPVGDYAREALRKAGIERAALANVVSNEHADPGVVAKVAAGEADAGIVFASDIAPAAARAVRAVPIPHAMNVIAVYTIAVVEGSAHQPLAEEFLRYVIGPEGQAALGRYGFLPPP